MTIQADPLVLISVSVCAMGAGIALFMTSRRHKRDAPATAEQILALLDIPPRARQAPTLDELTCVSGLKRARVRRAIAALHRVGLLTSNEQLLFTDEYLQLQRRVALTPAGKAASRARTPPCDGEPSAKSADRPPGSGDETASAPGPVISGEPLELWKPHVRSRGPSQTPQQDQPGRRTPSVRRRH